MVKPYTGAKLVCSEKCEFPMYAGPVDSECRCGGTIKIVFFQDDTPKPYSKN